MRNRHLFHILPVSPWPLLTSFSGLLVTGSLAFYMHDLPFAGYLFLISLLTLACSAYIWCNDIVDEATFSGFHTQPVRFGLRLGFLLFIVSELMLFFGFFWAFFHAALCPAIEIGSIFPPEGIFVIPVFEFPLFNTFVLILSGFSVTWAHRAMILGWYKETIDSLLITIFLGFFFVILQIFEYYEAPFSYSDSVYGCSFYMLTGLHGFHVIAGASFLLVCLIRLLNRHFLTTHHLGFEFAIWYWHFVDVVWIFLFLSVYCWGSW